MRRFRHHLHRIGAFAAKEVREVSRQPKLVLSLIIGPFLILGLFALGFHPRPLALRTLLVMPSDSELADRAGDLEESLQPFIEVVGITQDPDGATRRLLDGEVDLVVVTPPNAIERIRNGEHATIQVLHTQLDPFEQSNIAIFARTSIDELNRTLLAEVARVGQGRVEASDDVLPAARESAEALTRALRTGDEQAARNAALELDRALLLVDRQLASSAEVYEGLDRGLGVDGEGPFASFSGLRDEVANIDSADPDAADAAAAVEENIAALEVALQEFTRIPPEVAVQPFVSDERLASGADIPMTTYYAPAVMVVLIQHLSITFAALSVMRERSLGTTEVVRVGPTTVADLLLGKYLGYSLIAGVISTVLVTGLVFGFGVPMAGSWSWLAGLMAMLIVASLAFGFLIAAFSDSDSQAVQFSMLALLFTIFFSGFVLSLDRLTDIVKGVAFLVPATPGISAVQDVMFRGQPPRPLVVAVLALYALAVFVVSTLLLGRRFRTRGPGMRSFAMG